MPASVIRGWRCRRWAHIEGGVASLVAFWSAPCPSLFLQVHPDGGSQGRAKGDDGDVEKAVVLDPNAPPPHQAMGQGGYPGPQHPQQPYGAPAAGYDPYAAGGAYAANQYATSPTGVDPAYGGAYGGYPPAQPYVPYGAPPEQPYGYGGQQPYGQEHLQPAAPAFGQPQQQPH